MRFSKYVLILGIILLSGLFLRLGGLTSESIWLDEGISFKLASVNPLVVIVERAFNNHPPVYFIILHYWLRLFGESIFAGRLLSVIFGVLAIWMLASVGSLIFNKRIAVTSSLLLAVSLFHIYYSQEIRMYTLTALLSLGSMYFFIRLFEKRSRGISAGYILTSLSLLYTHYSALLVLLVQNIYFFILLAYGRKRDELTVKRWLKFQGILFLLYLPWLKVALSRLTDIQSAHCWIPRPTVFTLADTFMEFSGSPTLLLIFVALSAISALSAKRGMKDRPLGDTHNTYLLSFL